MTTSDPTLQSRKPRYHHGDLREALIQATHQLVVERGADAFTLADACRLAGVSTAAPYRHFRDKQEILEELAKRGFDALAQRSMAAVLANGPGSLEGIIAMGRAYIAFAVEETATFRLMFGQNPRLKQAEHVLVTGRSCFQGVTGEVARYCERNGLEGDARQIALALWTFVHGAACLLIDRDYHCVDPEINVDALIAAATPGLLRAGVAPR
jgi:AcrR family transcriptional regulator